jgi:hypothetical protein
MAPFDAEAVLHKDVRRRSICGSLKEKFLCKRCQSKCTRCRRVITFLQRRLHDGKCLPCTDGGRRR